MNTIDCEGTWPLSHRVLEDGVTVAKFRHSFDARMFATRREGSAVRIAWNLETRIGSQCPYCVSKGVTLVAMFNRPQDRKWFLANRPAVKGSPN